MAELTINFTVTGGGAGQNTVQESGGNREQQRENAKEIVKASIALDTAKRFGRQIFDGYVSSIGERTGNYVQQAQIQRGVGLATKAVSIASAFVVNPFLGAVAVVGEGISMAFEEAQRRRDVMWSNREAEQLRRRAGFTANYNR